jgi:hypothetical protein
MRVLFAILALTTTAHAAPPAPFAAAVKHDCKSPTWTRIADDTWFAYCAPSDPEAGTHRGLLFHHAAGAKTFDKLVMFDLEAQHAIKGSDTDIGVMIAVDHKQLSIRTNGYAGDQILETWDLGTTPPRLVKASYGGASAWSSAMAPITHKCTVDLVRHRDRCSWGRPGCTKSQKPEDIWDTNDPRDFRSIPLRCPATFGDDKADVYFGKNPRGTTFEAFADQAFQPTRVTLHLRVKDATPALATKPDAWQPADHWEIWLGHAGDPTANWREDQPKYCAALAKDFVQLIVAAHADGTLELANGAPKSKVSIADATAKAGKDGELIVELTGTLATWASDGSITVSYSDSLDGTKQDTLIGSSHVVWGKPDSFGRLGNDTLCRTAPAPEQLPWPT